MLPRVGAMTFPRRVLVERPIESIPPPRDNGPKVTDSRVFRMRGHDQSTGQHIHWDAPIMDAAAVHYRGPGPVSDVTVQGVSKNEGIVARRSRPRPVAQTLPEPAPELVPAPVLVLVPVPAPAMELIPVSPPRPALRFPVGSIAALRPVAGRFSSCEETLT